MEGLYYNASRHKVPVWVEWTGQKGTMFKVVLLGEAGVGKSSIFLRLKDNIFGDSLQPTVGIESCSKVMKIDSQNITVCIQRSSVTAVVHAQFNITFIFLNILSVNLAYKFLQSSCIDNSCM